MAETIFDAEPHPDERVEWLRAQVEAYLTALNEPDQRFDIRFDALILQGFVEWMEERFMPRGLFDR